MRMAKKRLFEEKYGTIPALRDFLPDWTDNSRYRFPAKMTPQLWAWQFLRRNQHYRSLWGTFFYDEFRENPDLLQKAGSLRSSRADDGSIEFVSTDKRLAKLCNSASTFYRYFGILSFPPSPAEDFPDIDFEIRQMRKHPIRGINEKIKKRKTSGEDITYVFSLDVSLERQLDEAKDFLENERKRKGITEFRMRSKEYPAYLRILDAKLHYQKTDVIAKVVFPARANSSEYNHKHSALQNVRDHYDAAKTLRDRDYRLLAGCRNKK